MVNWEVCPAFVEGLEKLPLLEEDQESGFRSKDGWYMRDPLAKQMKDQAQMHAVRWGIDRLRGQCAMAQYGVVPSAALSEKRTKEWLSRQRLAKTSAEHLPEEPSLEELRLAPHTVEPTESRLVATKEGISSEGAVSRTRHRRRCARRGGVGDGEGSISIWTHDTSGAPS